MLNVRILYLARIFIFPLVLISGLSQANENTADTIINAGYLISIPGEKPLENVSIFIKNGKITKIGKQFEKGKNTIDLRNAYVMPGFIDLHAHITFEYSETDLLNVRSKLLDVYTGRRSRLVLDALPLVETLLNQGFTTIRNLGDPAGVVYDLRDAINAGKVKGPRIIGTEAQINISGGVYDPAVLKLRAEFERLLPIYSYASGADGMTDIVRREVLRGADVIKLRIDGGYSKELRETEEEIMAVVATAKRLGRRVAAHSGTVKATPVLVKAGVASIEHGPVGAENFDSMREAGVVYVPTIATLDNNRELAKEWAEGRMDPYQVILDEVRQAHKAGVKIGLGSDAPAIPHAEANTEFEFLVKAGLTPTDALRAATVVAAETLGRETDLGTLEAGKLADIVATRTNPLNDIKAVKDVFFVMKEGTIYRQ